MQSRDYHLPKPIGERVRLWFFANEHLFLDHVRGHFARPEEPWIEVAGEEVVKKCRQIIDRPAVSDVGEVYDHLVQVLDDGIENSVSRPVFVVADQKAGGGERRSYCFLADAGFYVAGHGDCVRTALFVCDRPTDAPGTRYRKAWHTLKAKYGPRSYRDAKGGEMVVNNAVAWVSQENWNNCPVSEPLRPAGSVAATGPLWAKLGRVLGEGSE
jgi:hypothetical protein